MLTSVEFLHQVNVKKSKKLARITKIEEKSLHSF